MLFALYAAVAVLSLALFFYLVVYPFVCMIECGLSKQLSGGTKAVWIIATFITGALGAIVYTFVGMQSARLRKTAISGLVVGACSLAACMGIGFAQPEVAQQAFSFLPESDGEFGANMDQSFSFEEAFEKAGVDLTQFDETIEQFEGTVDALKVATQETLDHHLAELDHGNEPNSKLEEQTPEGLLTSRSKAKQVADSNESLDLQDGSSDEQSLASILEGKGDETSGGVNPTESVDQPFRTVPAPQAQNTPVTKPKRSAPPIVNRYTNRTYTAGGKGSPAAPVNRNPAPVRNRYTNQ